MNTLRGLGWFLLGAASATAVLALLATRSRNVQLIRVKSLPDVGGRYWRAWTIPPLGIFIREDEIGNADLIAHELQHWQQYEQMGVFQFPIDYALQVMRFGYHQAPMEVQARAAEQFGFKHPIALPTITD